MNHAMIPESPSQKRRLPPAYSSGRIVTLTNLFYFFISSRIVFQKCLWFKLMSTEQSNRQILLCHKQILQEWPLLGHCNVKFLLGFIPLYVKLI